MDKLRITKACVAFYVSLRWKWEKERKMDISKLRMTHWMYFLSYCKPTERMIFLGNAVLTSLTNWANILRNALKMREKTVFAEQQKLIRLKN